jgi:hypothetical protein
MKLMNALCGEKCRITDCFNRLNLSVNITVFVQHVSAPNDALKISSQYDKEARVFANPGKPYSPCEPPGVHQHCL